MEYIEQKPPVVKPHEKRNKIILASVISAIAVVAVVLTYYFTITKIFLDYDNISLFTFSYRYDIEGDGVCIESVRENDLPKKLRIPSQLDGRPVVEIADNVFSENTSIEEVIFPDTLKKIGDNCFDGCTNLRTFNVPASLTEIGTNAFDRTAWLENQEDGEVTIGSMLYTYNGEMEYPAAIVKDENSVSSSEYKTIINLGKYNNMSSGVFYGQSNLVYVEIPDNFTEIKDATFADCDQLEEVILPDSITSIGNSAFSNCYYLSDIELPEKLNYIGDDAFAYTLLSGEITFNSSLSYLGEGAFRGCKEITSVTFPENFADVPDYLFEDCSSLESVNFASKDYSTESTISYIGANSFKGTAISEFKVPFNVSTIESGAFSECLSLKSVYVYNNLINSKEISYVYDEETGKSSFVKSTSSQGIISFGTELFKDSSSFEELLLVDEDGTLISDRGEVSIPVTASTLGGTSQEAHFFTGTNVKILNLFQDLQGISDEEYKENLSSSLISTLPPTFAQGATNLITVNFGDEEQASIGTINRAAFMDCTNLIDVVLPDTVTTIMSNAFENCLALNSVVLSNNINALPTRIFANCTSLESITIPSLYCKSIGSEAFLNCVSLEEVNHSEGNGSITNIAQSAFKGCLSLQSFVVSSSCESFSNEIFSGCTSLESIEFSLDCKITTIPVGVFEDNKALKTIVLPSKISSIGINAFKNSGLENLYLNSDAVVTIDSSTFEGAPLKNIYVSEELVDQYKASSLWSEYESIIRAI